MKTAFSAFVFGSYQNFIPYYIYTIQKNYPDSDIILFYHSELSKEVKLYIQRFDKVIIYENFFSELSWFKNIKLKGGGGLTLLRFLIPSSYFSEYDYVYFGDVDILILREPESLFDFHAKQVAKSNVPFSNRVRFLEEGGLSKRLTGLHFVEVKPYFEKIDPLIESFLNNKEFQEKLLYGLIRDEEFLYNLNMLAFNFDPEKVSHNKVPWHGFHLGLVRGKNFLDTKAIKEQSGVTIKELQTQLTEFLNDYKFLQLMKNIYCPQLFFTYQSLDFKLPLSITLRYQSQKLKNKVFTKYKSLLIKYKNR